jgi:hypothetical protein
VLLIATAQARQAVNRPLPDIRQLMHEVEDHQKQLEELRENYTYDSLQTVEDIDSSGHVQKTESEQYNDFFVNGHLIERLVKKDGKPLSPHDEAKESDRVTKLVEKAQKIPPNQPLEGDTISVSRLLDIMDVRNPRRAIFRGRSTIVFDFIGRKDAKTHGMVEDASKKLQGTIWVDETDRQVVHLDVSFKDNFHIAGGLFANVEKGSNIHFDQGPLEKGLWLPIGAEANMQVRLLMVKNLHQHITERDSDFKQFRVETQQPKEAKAAPAAKP